MIAKQIKGSSFSQALKYVEGKKGSRQIGTNMSGRNPRELAAEFRIAQHLNYRVNKPVYHCSLSIHPEEKLSDQQWLSIAQDYLRGMKFNHNQYVVYRHQDTDHEHIHIIANRVGLDGKTVSDSWDYLRSEQVIQQLAQKYGLSQVPLSQSQRKKAPTTGEIRRTQRTGEKPIRTQLQAAIDSFTTKTNKKITLDELVEKLAEKGIETRISYSQEGEMRGISYKLDDLAFSGYQLGQAYTINGLQKYQNVVTKLEPDQTNQQKLGENVKKTETPNQLSYDDADTPSLPTEEKLITEKLQEPVSVRVQEIRRTPEPEFEVESELEI